MYKIKYTELAKKDIEDIIFYISNIKKNKKAAVILKECFKKEEKNIIKFPYGVSVYKIGNQLKHEYRRVVVKKYNVFYTIDEKNKFIIISPVLYQKRDFVNILR